MSVLPMSETLSVRHYVGAHFEIYELLQDLRRNRITLDPDLSQNTSSSPQPSQRQTNLLAEERAKASSESEREALSAARAWLKLIDTRQWEKSWRTASPLLRQRFSLDKWKSARSQTPHRKEMAELRRLHQVQTLPKSPTGQGTAVLLQFATRVTGTSVLELIVMVEEDDEWASAGYQISRGILP